MSTGQRRLLAGYAAADGVELEAGVLSGFYSTANGFADKGGDLDSAFLYVEDHRSSGGKCGLVR